MKLPFVALAASLLASSSSTLVWESDQFRNDGLGHIHYLDDRASSLLAGNMSEEKARFLAVVGRASGDDDEMDDFKLIHESSGGNSGVFSGVLWQEGLAVSRRDEVVSSEKLKVAEGGICGWYSNGIPGLKVDGDELNVQDSVLVDQVSSDTSTKALEAKVSRKLDYPNLIFVVILAIVSFFFLSSELRLIQSSYTRVLYDRGYNWTLRAILKLVPNLPPTLNGQNNWSCRYLVLGLSCLLITNVNGTRATGLRGGYKDTSGQVFPLYEGVSTAPRYLEEASSEPFTIASLDAGAVLGALDKAKEAVTEYVAEEFNEIFKPFKDQLPTLIGDISPDSIKNISTKLIDCFEGLDDGNLDRLENITSFISSFSPDAALDTLLDPDEGGSCSAPDLGLPDISYVKDEARAFSLYLYECIADTIRDINLGPISISVPDLNVNRRELEEEEDDEDEKYFGITVGLGASVDVELANFVSATAAGVGIEFGYDDGKRGDPAPGFGFAFNAPFSAAQVTLFTVKDSCPAGYFCPLNNNGEFEKKKCPAGQYCEGGKPKKDAKPDGDCKKGYYCPEGSTSSLGQPIERFIFTDPSSKRTYTACGAGRVCRCEARFWCPEGSTTLRGKPTRDRTITSNIPTLPFTCKLGRECACLGGYYCPINSALPKRCPDIFKCNKIKCGNPTCTPSVTNSQVQTWYGKLLSSQKNDLVDPEFSVGLTIQMYWDVGAATFNGGNGFAIDIELPFDFLPNVSLIFLAPPFHCPVSGASYVLAGIGLGTPLSISVPLSDLSNVRVTSALIKTFISEEAKSFLGKFKQFKKDVQNGVKAVASGNSLGFGFAHSYDASFNEVEDRYDWSETCRDENRRTQGNSLSAVDLPISTPSKSPAASNPTKPPSSSHTTNPTTSLTTSPSLKPTSLRRRTQDNSLSVVELPNQSRALEAKPSTEDVSSVISVLASSLGRGGIPFCAGGCDVTPKDDSKVIQGIFTSRYTQTCDGVRLSALVSDAITVNKVLYLTLNQVSEELADATIAFLSTIKLGDFGIENVEVVLEVDASFPSIELSLSGDPALPALGEDADDATTFFYNLFNGLNFGITSRIRQGGANLELSASTVAQVPNDNSFAVVDVDGNGFTIFFEYEILPLTGGLSRTQIVKLGLRLPLRICVRDCGPDSSDPEIIYLKGEVSVSQVVGIVPATLLGGQLELVGEWNNPFELPILNVYNVIAGAEFDLSKAAATSGIPPPSSLILGAMACLGSKDACKEKDPTAKDFIFGSAYIGINTVVQQKNFVFGLFSSFTIEEILNVANELLDSSLNGVDLDDLIDGLPGSVLKSGITPLDADNSTCGPVNTTALATGKEKLNLDCYAWVSISPFGENEIESINLNIPKGIGFSGKLNLFNEFIVEAEAQIDVIDTLTPKFFLNASLEATLGSDGFELFIGENLTADNSGVEGAAQLLIDYKQGISLLVDIQAAVAIPLLRTYGDVTIQVNADGALLVGEITFLEVLNPYVKIKWDWAFNNFYAELGNIVFYPGILEMKELVLDVETQPSVDLSFEIDITVLSFADLGATLSMEERNNGEDLFVDFTLVADVDLVETTVKGDAILDLVTIGNTQWGEFDVSVAWGGAAAAIADFVEFAITAIKERIEDTIQAVSVAIEAIGKAILGFINSIPFIAEVFDAVAEAGESFKDGLDSLFNNGDLSALAEAAITLADDFDKTFEETNWEEQGNQVATQAENLGLFFTNALGLSSTSKNSKIVTLSDKDQWGCNYIRVDVTTQKCWGVTVGICTDLCPDCCYRIQKCNPPKTKNGPNLQNPKCVKEKQALLQKTRAMLVKAGAIGTGSKVTMEGNAAILREDRARIPEANFDNITGSVPYNKGCSLVSLQSKISGSTKILDNNAAGGISNSGTSFQTDDMVDLDFTPSCGNASRFEDGSSTSQAYVNSVREGIAALKNHVNKTVNKDMSGIDPAINAYQPEVQLIPLTIGFANNPNDVVLEITCSMLNEANKQRPQILTSDPDCKTTLTYETIGETFDVPPKYTCGTAELTRRWTVSDICGQSDYVDQTMYQQPQAPIWTDNPWSEAVYTFSTSAETFSPAASNSWPTAESECGYPVSIESDNSDTPTKVSGECGLWLMTRTWVAFLDIDVSPLKETCAHNGNPPPPTSTVDQLFYVKDDEAPTVKEDVTHKPTRIPFFDNYNSTRLNAPLIKDIATNEQAQELGLTAGEVTLTSEDTDLMFSRTNLDDQGTCRTDGIAHFIRTWTAADKCGNKVIFPQKIILKHPPEVKTSTASLEDGIYSFSPGVVQSTNTCVPGKQVYNGPKSFEAEYDFSVTSNVCREGEVWEENGCRLLSALYDPVEVLSVAPEYTSFPADVTVLTNQSISADEDGTGRPMGEAFCNTPFEIVHEDKAAELVSCGVWEIKRHWFIRPVYLDCDVVIDPRLVTKEIQIITVKDVLPPEFVDLPAADVDVPFLKDYGPGNAVVGYPLVQEQIESETLRAHAQKFNTAENFLFVSYQTTLSFVDVVTYQETREDVCEAGSLATVTRTWTTMDRCGNSDAWIQTIDITPPAQKLFGDASGYQVAAPNGYVQLRSSSNFSHPVMSQGNKFGLWDSVVYGSERLANSIDGDSSAVSIVLDSCPTSSLKQEFLPDGDLLYIGGGKKCNTKKLNSVVELDAATSPVNFESAVKAIQSMSDIISEGPKDLLTGPQTINCTTPNVPTSCVDLKMASIQPIQVSPEVSSNELILSKNPLSFVYNLFNVDMNNWFYNTEVFQTVKEVRVEAEGFVFVNVLDNVEVTGLGNDEYNIIRGWDDTLESSLCDVSTANSQSMPILGNYNDSLDVTLTYGLRGVTAGDYAQDPSTHLLINLRTNIELSSNTDGVTVADVAPCSGLRYRFSKIREDSITKGSYVLPNEMSSFEMWDYEWNGQLVTIGAQVDMRTVMTPPKSLYFPDDSSFCPAAQEEESI